MRAVFAIHRLRDARGSHERRNALELRPPIGDGDGLTKRTLQPDRRRKLWERWYGIDRVDKRVGSLAQHRKPTVTEWKASDANGLVSFGDLIKRNSISGCAEVLDVRVRPKCRRHALVGTTHHVIEPRTHQVDFVAAF